MRAETVWERFLGSQGLYSSEMMQEGETYDKIPDICRLAHLHDIILVYHIVCYA
jgi:hypothetical protein